MDCKGYLLPLTLIVRFKKKEFTYKTQGKVAKMSTKYGDPINSLTRMLRSELGEHLIPVEDFVDKYLCRNIYRLGDSIRVVSAAFLCN